MPGADVVATHQAARVITVSEASKRDILRYFRVPESKIDVIYNAIDDRFWEGPTADEMMLVRERYRLTDPFVLYAGNIKPHKNLERLIEAFHLMRTITRISRTCSC
jgi:glycosyltransferase involved in cell wall biosynthesis